MVRSKKLIDRKGELRTRSTPALKVSREGRMVIPAALRHQLGIDKGDELVAWTEGEKIVVMTRKAAVRDLQRMAAEKVKRPAGKSVVDELIRERRREAKRENKS